MKVTRAQVELNRERILDNAAHGIIGIGNDVAHAGGNINPVNWF